MNKRIPYYTVRNGNGFWEPRGRMRQLGFEPRPCGPDGPLAHAIAEEMNLRWQAARDSGAVSVSPRPPRRKGFVYFLASGGDIKIGFSIRPLSRLDDVRNGISTPLERAVVVRGTKQDEKRLHRELRAFQRRGEWFVAAAPVIRAMYKALTIGLEGVAPGTDCEPVSECPGITPSLIRKAP